MRPLTFFITLLLPLALLQGCDDSPSHPSPTSQPSTTTGAIPATAPSPTTQPRVVSMVPAATLNLVLIGATDHLVGVTKYDLIFLPIDKQTLPVVGDYETMNLERLVELKPTAVVIQIAAPRVSERLRDIASQNHIELLNVKLDTLDDLWHMVHDLGRISNCQDAADTAILSAQEELKTIAQETQIRPRVKVAYVVERDPMFLVGAHTFLDQMLTLAGGDNVGASVGDVYPIVSKEMLMKLAPDVLLISATDEPPQQENDPRIEPYLSLPIPAVRNHRVFLVTDGNSLLASVDLPAHVRALMDLLHKNEPATPPPATPTTQGAPR